MQAVPVVTVAAPTVVIETHRGSSRTAAYSDIVLTFLRLGASLYVGLQLYQQDGEKQGITVYILVMLGILFFLYLINLVFAFGLLKATELTTPLTESLRKTQSWYNFNAFLFFLESISINILGIIVRGVLLCTINRYLNELKLASQAAALKTINEANTQVQVVVTTATSPVSADLPNTFNINLNQTVHPNMPTEEASLKHDTQFQNLSESNPGYPNNPPPYSG